MPRKWSREDISIIEELMKRNAFQTYAYMREVLTKYYKDAVVKNPQFLLAFGKDPVALVAHMDTVEEIKNKCEVIYDTNKNIATTLHTFGFDDKLGLFTIIKLLQAGYRPNLILTMGEERGGTGANAIVNTYPVCPFPEVKYLMELDRAGYMNFVTYSNKDPYIEGYITSTTKYLKEIGTFSDVDIIGPAWKVGFVNMSISYYNEHTANEHVKVGEWFESLEEIEKLLKDLPKAPKFDYDYDPTGGWGFLDSIYEIGNYCENCYRTGLTPYETVIDELGNDIKLCPTCKANLVEQCDKCGLDYIPEMGQKDCMCTRCTSDFSRKHKQIYTF